MVRHFMDHCADEAAARGWTALDLFGVHRTAGAAAVDSCGALMLPGTSAATVIRTDAITFGHLVYRKRLMPQVVPVWEFSSADRRTALVGKTMASTGFGQFLDTTTHEGENT